MSFLLGLAIVTLLVWVVGGGEVAVGARRIVFLRDIELGGAERAPSVSVVLAARNEEAKVRHGAESVLAQEAVDLELLAVNDRSEDATGALLDEVARDRPEARVLHLDHLPAGWLGKTHALHTGAAAARGDWLLFVDADVILSPWTVARAIRYADAHGVDHLAATPELAMPTAASDLFGGVFVLLFSRFARPWKAREAGSRAHVGIGAFNLVRREVYEAVGGHTRVRLRPDDDMMLGKLIKSAGYRQDVVYGTGEVRVEWYGSLAESVQGLEKNAFAGLGYSAAAVAAATVSLLVFLVWPWLGVFLTPGAARALNLGSVAIMVGLYAGSARASGANPWLAPGIPIAILVFCYTLVRSAALALTRGEIRWRGTSYELDELRRFRL